MLFVFFAPFCMQNSWAIKDDDVGLEKRRTTLAKRYYSFSGSVWGTTIETLSDFFETALPKQTEASEEMRPSTLESSALPSFRRAKWSYEIMTSAQRITATADYFVDEREDNVLVVVPHLMVSKRNSTAFEFSPPTFKHLKRSTQEKYARFNGEEKQRKYKDLERKAAQIKAAAEDHASQEPSLKERIPETNYDFWLSFVQEKCRFANKGLAIAEKQRLLAELLLIDRQKASCVRSSTCLIVSDKHASRKENDFSVPQFLSHLREVFPNKPLNIFSYSLSPGHMCYANLSIDPMNHCRLDVYDSVGLKGLFQRSRQKRSGQALRRTMSRVSFRHESLTCSHKMLGHQVLNSYDCGRFATIYLLYALSGKAPETLTPFEIYRGFAFLGNNHFDKDPLTHRPPPSRLQKALLASKATRRAKIAAEISRLEKSQRETNPQ